MYQCDNHRLQHTCPTSEATCRTNDCICHEDPHGKRAVLKLKENGCWRCYRQCPSWPSAARNCKCPDGCKIFESSGYGACYTGESVFGDYDKCGVRGDNVAPNVTGV